MMPLVKLPPGLDPFAQLGPLAPLLEPLVRLLRVPLELVYTALVLGNVRIGGPAVGAVFEGLLLAFLTAAAVVVLLAILLGLGLGSLLAAAVVGYRRRAKASEGR